MTRIFERQQFVHQGDLTDYGGRIFEDLEFRRCYFEGCALSVTQDPQQRSIVRNVKIVTCEQRGCAIDTAIIEDVVVDGLKTNGLLQTWGAVFKHVTLRGKIGRIMLSPAVSTGRASVEEQRVFDEANARYYADVDWALDISEAEFVEGEIQGVPARLVRRDRATQVIVTRQKALEGRWRNLDLSGTHWATSIEFLLDRKDADVVLVAPKRARDFWALLNGLTMLRDAGVAEPD